MTSLDAAAFDYRLLRGSHEFPGPAGGACLNEAAIVAAGFDYRRVLSAADCLPCFSRPIAAYAIALNDMLSDENRQRLKPFVLRLAGTADLTEIEYQRVAFLQMFLVRGFTALRLSKIGFLTQASALLSSLDREILLDHLKEIEWVGLFESDVSVLSHLLRCYSPRDILYCFLQWMSDISFQDFADIAIDALDQVLAIGRQAPAIPDAEALVRLGTVFAPATREPATA